MGHCVTGLIAKPEVLETFAQRHSLPAPALLGSGLAILPLRVDDLDAFLEPPLTGGVKGLVHFSDQLIQTLTDVSEHDMLMYFETD